MSTKVKVAAVVVLLLLVAGVVLLIPGNEPGQEPAPPVPNVVADNDGSAAPEDEPPPVPGPAPDAIPAPVAETTETSTVRILFTDEDGAEIGAEEVRRLYRQAGIDPAVELISDAGLHAGDQAAMVELLFGPPEAWRTRTQLLWGETGLSLEKAPEAGKWRLFLPRPGAAPLLTRTFEVAEGAEAELRIVLPREPSVRKVRVEDAETGEPVPGAEITPYFEYGDDQAFLPGPSVVADGNGLASLPILEKGEPGTMRQPTWWAESDGRVGRLEGWVLGSRPEVVPIRLHATATVEGHAWLSSGEPAVGFEVVWTRKGRMVRTRVRQDGTYRVAGVPVGPSGSSSEMVVLLEDLKKLKVGLVKAQVSPGATVSVDIGSPPPQGGGAAIHGVLRAGTRALEGVAVFVTPPRGGDPIQTTLTDEEGSYRLENLPTDGFGIVVVLGDMRASDDYLIRSTEPLRVGAGEDRELSFDLPDGAILVKVVDDESGEPVAGAIGYARPADREAARDLFPGFRYGPGWAGFTGEDGTVLLYAQVSGRPAVVNAVGEGISRGTVEDVSPGAVDAPAEVTIRVKQSR